MLAAWLHLAKFTLDRLRPLTLRWLLLGTSGGVLGFVIGQWARHGTGDPVRIGQRLAVHGSGGLLRADALDGVGLANARERLQRWFGAEPWLSVALDAQGFSVASLGWPQPLPDLPQADGRRREVPAQAPDLPPQADTPSTG